MKYLYIRLKTLFRFLLKNSKPGNQAPYLIKTENQILSKGRESYHNGNFIVKGDGILEIGSFCAIGSDVKVVLSNHDLTKISIQYTLYKKILGETFNNTKIVTKIENDVWVGDNSIILPGVTIGSGAVIGAGAIVTKDVPPYTIVAGNPAKIIRKRFELEKIEKLLELRWWDWNDEKIKDNKSLFLNK